jgi:hypothetical protein
MLDRPFVSPTWMGAAHSERSLDDDMTPVMTSRTRFCPEAECQAGQAGECCRGQHVDPKLHAEAVGPATPEHFASAL